jgi:hypothetical protein
MKGFRAGGPGPRDTGDPLGFSDSGRGRRPIFRDSSSG